jgi:hypothetical protein
VRELLKLLPLMPGHNPYFPGNDLPCQPDTNDGMW